MIAGPPYFGESGDAIDQPIRADLLRLVDEQGEAQIEVRRDDERLAAQAVARHFDERGRDAGNHARQDDAVDVGERTAVGGGHGGEQGEPVVRHPLAGSAEPIGRGAFGAAGAVDAENCVGVADFDREKHAPHTVDE